MKKFFHTLPGELEKDHRLVLGTLLGTKGSVPQVPGASALFSDVGLKAGTLGGGILEGDATRRALEILNKGASIVYEFELNAKITDEFGAICGGTATLLLDANPGNSKDAFARIDQSILNGHPGVLATLISGIAEIEIERFWFEKGELKESKVLSEWKDAEKEMALCLEQRICLYSKRSETLAVFLEPVFPLPKLIIAGAGHIGKALARMSNLLDFEITVIDDRKEYANRENIPEADHIVVDNIGEAIRRTARTSDTYIVIVTRGHRDDTEALKACIGSDVPYIGMIGSKRKIGLMRENFISQGWATGEQFDRIHAPVGLQINSKTVQEIALSICAQLVQERNQEIQGKSHSIDAIILAAGASKRMGKPKMLLPFGDVSIIEKVVIQAIRSDLDKIFVVLGADAEPIMELLENYPVKSVRNAKHKEGMLSSVQCGLRAIPDATDAVMVLLGDQPMVGDAVMNKLMETYKRSHREIIIATHGNKRGHPILIGRKYIHEIIGFPAEKSLRDLLQKYPGDIEEVNIESPEILRDIDNEQDYKAELKHQNNYD